MLPRVKKMWDEYRHMNYLKLNGGVDPCAAIRARLAEVEAQNKRLAGTVRMLIGCIEDTKKYPDMHDDFVEELEAAREALAKLEAHNGK